MIKSQEEEQKVQELGKNPKGTLWDTDRGTDTLRILVEEAKVNICIRLIKDYKFWLHSPCKQADIEECSKRHRIASDVIQQTLVIFR